VELTGVPKCRMWGRIYFSSYVIMRQGKASPIASGVSDPTTTSQLQRRYDMRHEMLTLFAITSI
jgi:hypothetical protein